MTNETGLKPILKAGASYFFEMIRGAILGVVLAAVGFMLLIWVIAPGLSGKLLGVGMVFSLVMLLLYAAAGHQRGLGRALSRLTSSHGELFFDQTVGRFTDAVESRKPGALVALLAAPQKLADAFSDFLAESRLLPGWMKRVATRYVTGLGERFSTADLQSPELMRDGQFDKAGFRRWAVNAMQDQFAPSWKSFGVLLAVHAVGLAALGFLRA